MDQSVNLSDIPYPIPLDQSVPFNQQRVLTPFSHTELSINKCTSFIIIKYDCDEEQETGEAQGYEEGVYDDEDEGEIHQEDEEDENYSKKPAKTRDYSKLFKDNNSDIIKTTGYSREELENMSILEIRKHFKRKTEIYNYVLKVRRRSKNRNYSIKSRLSKKK